MKLVGDKNNNSNNIEFIWKIKQNNKTLVDVIGNKMSRCMDIMSTGAGHQRCIINPIFLRHTIVQS